MSICVCQWLHALSDEELAAVVGCFQKEVTTRWPDVAHTFTEEELANPDWVVKKIAETQARFSCKQGAKPQ